MKYTEETNPAIEILKKAEENILLFGEDVVEDLEKWAKKIPYLAYIAPQDCHTHNIAADAASDIDTAFEELEGIFRNVYMPDHLHITYETEPQRIDVAPIRYKRVAHIVNTLWLHNMDTSDKPILINLIDSFMPPSLQHNLLNMLVNMFPSKRFIVTTYSPLVISSANNLHWKVYKTYSHSELKEVQSYGLDASTILEIDMDTSPCDEKIADQLNHARGLIDIGMDFEAQDVLNNLYKIPGFREIPLARELQLVLDSYNTKEDE